jgi:hypothetical protein
VIGNRGIITLLYLHQEVIDQGDGYWVKIEAWEVAVSEVVPHGVHYSLTLDNPKGLKILGYDNTYAVRPRTGYSGRKLATITGILVQVILALPMSLGMRTNS